MVPEGNLKDLLNQQDYSRSEKVLICLATTPLGPRQVRDIKRLAKAAGLRKIDRWNVSQILADTKGLAVRTDDGWELSLDGQRRVAELAGPLAGSAIPRVAGSLRHHLASISDPEVRAFAEEAVECMEGQHYRAAVVLSWVGAVAVLYDFVLTHKLKEFNSEASRRNPKWKDAVTPDDLAEMKEYHFLHVLQAISVIGKSVKQELEGCLRLRNGCGHPNSLVLADSRAAGHVESLILNVFAKFSG